MKKKVKLTVSGNKRGLFQDLWRDRMVYCLLIPFLLFLFIFKYRPMYGIVLAFKDYRIRDGILGSPWAGFKYFEQLFTGFSFWEVLRNTLIITFSKLIFSFPAPIVLAIFINEIRNGAVKKVFQTVSYLPYFLSWVVVGSFVDNMLAIDGPINWLIEQLGGKQIYFMALPQYFREIVVLSDIWKGIGWGSIIYLAAITSIDPQLYEAAEIDGASRMRRIWHITLPGIRSTILTLFIMQVGGIMSAGFDQIFNLYTPTTMSVGDVLDTYVYRQGLVEGNYSYATAAGLFMNVIGFALMLITNGLIKRLSGGEEGIW